MLGHGVKLMPPRYVKPDVKRNKNAAADAEAIGEAVTRPSMRFVAVKSAERKSVLMVHRTRALLVRQRIMLVNALRAHMAEFGVVARVGLPQVKKLLAVIADGDDERMPPLARICLEGLVRQLLSLECQGKLRVGRGPRWVDAGLVQSSAGLPLVGQYQKQSREKRTWPLECGLLREEQPQSIISGKSVSNQQEIFSGRNRSNSSGSR